ncbi:Flavocytochrome c [Basidiobolus meristosporus CBS 931.73]|uniref:fumarate reductase (NADH) n=1 Tax=Basidiobolus meristosporus CBS 931.73 TaxID=1314790 RepID=A0A1Y1Y885_9FUNG|nr:Flavocytochrome c [Basidiobolus meristosporus CBS 931.73]|eukprot:ORX94242.1 Flavocytochrome c [Basidiobolus meristosporus CBS 931.73]
MSTQNHKVIVVGGGLSGLAAAHTVYECGGNVILLDKSSFYGGNSTKATSGINGALTRTQIKQGIKDSVEAFYEDTAKSARDLIQPELVKVLTGDSASAIEWLQEKFSLDLSLLSRLGGHSFQRTHRGKEKFPGMTITYALMEKLEKLAKSEPHRVQCITKARATQLIRDDSGTVIGIEYEKKGQKIVEYGPVILATGGFAADFTDNSLIKQYRPEWVDLPTSNGDFSTGDGHKMAISVGGSMIHMDKIQVHPTGLIDPKDPDAKVKFLAAEALRGVGGILVNAEGERFCDELGHRDYVTGEMWKTKAPIRLILNSKASDSLEWHCKHYVGRGLMRQFASGQELAKEIGCDPKVLEKTFNQYNGFAEKKSDPFGKRFFHNVPFKMDDHFHVALMTPVLHYTMGGVQIDPESRVKGNDGLIQGLFACGELAGGVHGANRLGGSSLLGCVVFGRVAGNSASRYMFQNLASSTSVGSESEVAVRRLVNLANQLGAKINLNVVPEENRVQFDIKLEGNGFQSAPGGSSQPVEEAKEQPKKVEMKEYSLEEVAKHNTEKDCWVAVNGQVLDVTDFLSDHPGGKKSILLYAGRDATKEFNMLHEANVVEKYSPECIIGTLKK